MDDARLYEGVGVGRYGGALVLERNLRLTGEWDYFPSPVSRAVGAMVPSSKKSTVAAPRAE